MSRPPTTIAVRDATVGPLSGTKAVSWRRELDVVVRDAEGLADELREDRLGPLAHLGRGGQDADPALGGELDRGDARELDLARAREPGTVPGEGEADAAGRALAARAQRRPGRRTRARARPPRVVGLRPEPRELRGLGRTLQDLLAGDAVAQDLAGRGRVAGVVDVAPPDLERRDAELLGDPVEVGLGRELGLRSPESAERAVGRRVGPGRPGTDADVRAAVRPAACAARRATARPASACSTRRRP